MAKARVLYRLFLACVFAIGGGGLIIEEGKSAEGAIAVVIGVIFFLAAVRARKRTPAQ